MMAEYSGVLPARLRGMQKRLIFYLLLLILLPTVLLQFGGLDLGFDVTPLASRAIILLVLAGFWALLQDKLQLAIGVVNACFFTAAAVSVLLNGLANVGVGTELFFVPVALAGMFQDRLRMLLTVLGTVLVVIVSALLQNAGLLGSAAGPGGSLVWLAGGELILAIVLVALVLHLFGRSTRQALDDALFREQELKSLMAEHDRVNLELRDERNFSKAVIDNLPGVFFVMAPDGEIIHGNQFIQEVTGYSFDELQQLSLKELLTPEQLPLLLNKFREVRTQGHAVVNLDLRTREGTLLPYLFHGGQFTMQEQPYMVVLGFDISQLLEARRAVVLLNEQLEDQVGRLTSLIEVGAALTQGLRSADTMQVLLRQVTERLAVDAATVLHFDRDSEMLTWQSGTGFRTNGLEKTELKLGEGLTGRAASERRAIYVFDQAELEQGYQRWSLIADEGIHFYVAVPLVANDELEGVLELFHRSPLNPDAAWKEFLAALATQAALVFSTARILQTLATTNLELRRAYDTTIEGWSRALDLRDHETEGHSRRVTDLTVELARRLGASEDRLVHIRRGALLHDIGKMGVPDSILLKPGKLTDQERRVMQRHTSYAFEMLSPVEFLQPALDIPYSHHENWDGSGYPRGLRGEEIPLAARAFSVVDVYDALTSDRPYQAAWGEERALEYIAGQADKKFDPQVVAHFLEMTAERNN